MAIEHLLALVALGVILLVLPRNLVDSRADPDAQLLCCGLQTECIAVRGERLGQGKAFFLSRRDEICSFREEDGLISLDG